MNTNYFSNQTMGVNSLEKLHGTTFHYILDLISNQRTLGVSDLKRTVACCRGRVLCTPSTRLRCTLSFACGMTLGQVP